MNNNQSCAPNQIAKYNMCKITNPQTIVPAENSYPKVLTVGGRDGEK